MPIESKGKRHWTSRLPLPKKIDWYILAEVIGPFFGGLIFFIFIFLMFQALRLAEFFIVHGVAAGTLLKMTALLALSFLPTALPIAFLIAVLTAFSRLSADSELVAMKANGMGVTRLAVPLFGLAALVFSLSLVLMEEWVPWGETTFKRTLVKVGNTKVVSSIKEGTFTTGFFDLLIFADKIDTKSNQLSHVFIFDEREPKNPLAVVARSGEIVPVRTSTELGAAAVMKLYDGSIHTNDRSSSAYQKIGFGEYQLYLKIDEGGTEATQKPHMIPHGDLVKRLAKTDTSTFEGRELRGEFWRRYAVAMTPILFVFLGIGFGTFRTRGVRAGSALIAIVTMAIYWTVQSWATIMIHRGQLPPFFAMQLPNLLTAIAATITFRRAAW